MKKIVFLLGVFTLFFTGNTFAQEQGNSLENAKRVPAEKVQEEQLEKAETKPVMLKQQKTEIRKSEIKSKKAIPANANENSQSIRQEKEAKETPNSTN